MVFLISLSPYHVQINLYAQITLTCPIPFIQTYDSDLVTAYFNTFVSKMCLLLIAHKPHCYEILFVGPRGQLRHSPALVDTRVVVGIAQRSTYIVRIGRVASGIKSGIFIRHP